MGQRATGPDYQNSEASTQHCGSRSTAHNQSIIATLLPCTSWGQMNSHSNHTSSASRTKVSWLVNTAYNRTDGSKWLPDPEGAISAQVLKQQLIPSQLTHRNVTCWPSEGKSHILHGLWSPEHTVYSGSSICYLTIDTSSHLHTIAA